jgi:enamine deaminase RidA (YjgF/YER057c/UK114 family)
MEIRRWRGQATGRNRAVAYNGFVWAVATAPDRTQDMRGQTEQCVNLLERSLLDAGSDKTRIVSAQIFLADMSAKAAMDGIWNAWIGSDPDHWPQRACVGAPLADGCLVEIMLIAATR